MPYSVNYIFNRKMLYAALERIAVSQIADIQQKQRILSNWERTIKTQTLKGAGETPVHGDFLIDIFSNVLGYKRMAEHPEGWNLTPEKKTELDATKADGTLGFFTKETSDVRALIELKSADADVDAKQHRKQDKRSAVEQAFGYAPKYGKQCRWVIVSNYVELRLYHSSSAVEYEPFRIAELTNENEFKRFYYLLANENLIAKDGESVIDALYRKTEEEEKNISKRFYAEYTQARLNLFKHLKHKNPTVSVSGVELAEQHDLFLLQKTQKLLDRFIFICFCEDTGMLPERSFRKLVKRAQESFVSAENKIWDELKGLFELMDKGAPTRKIPPFNGELFKPDAELDALQIGDEIFDELAHITDYDFSSELNVNILGHIFEQSITDLEELRSHIQGEKLDRRQGKRKKEGIFYTPEYITRYIVENAVGGWLEDRKQELRLDDLPELTQTDYDSVKLVKSKYKGNKKIEQHRVFWEAYKAKLMNIKVLDPACGSGAFLNQAFDFLYKEGQRVNETLAILSKGQTTLFDLDKHILSNNLYGVDLNRESVEITKLSLWLKTAKKDAPLTALDSNIKCGNSLIDDPLAAGEKAFKWEKKFPEIMQTSGFDVVIGNPPYVRQEVLGPYKPHFERCYHAYHGMADLYVYFIEKGVSLLKPDGILSYIVANKWMRANYGKSLRIWLKQQRIHEIIDFGDLPVFQDATAYPCILQVSPGSPLEKFNAYEVRTLEFSNLMSHLHSKRYPVIQLSLQDEGWALVDERQQRLLDKLRRIGVPLGEYIQGKIYRGVLTGLNEAFVIDTETRNQLIAEDTRSEEFVKPFLAGRDIKRYQPSETEQFLILIPNGWTKEQSTGIDDKWAWFQTNYPAIAKHLEPYTEAAQKRWDKGEYWWELRACAYYNEFGKSKIIIPAIVRKGSYTFDDRGFYSNDKTSIIPTNDLYLFGLLNSKVPDFVISLISSTKRGGYFEYKPMYLQQLPIRPINFSDLSDKAKHDYVVERVHNMLDLHKQRQTILTQFLKLLTAEFSLQKLSKKLQNWSQLEWNAFEKELKKAKAKLTLPQKAEWMDYFEQQKAKVSVIQQQIDRTDDEIDRMVYELYGLTEEEIRIVEGN